MRLIVISAAALALACSSVEDRAACATSAGCPSGQYCARTSDGSVCWADAVRPAVSVVTASCATTPCVRDGVLRVEATVAEDKELATVEAALDLDSGARKVAMTAAGGRWVAELPLRDWPFEAYARPVVASVVARDGARNEGSAAAAPVEVTRLRWVYDAGVPMSPAAVMDDGTVVVGLSRTAEQLVAIHPDGTRAWAATVGTGFITAPPTVGTEALWIGSNDFWLRGAALDSGGSLTGVGVNLEGAIRGGTAIATTLGKEWAFAAAMSGRVGATSTVVGEDAKSVATNAYVSGAVIGRDGRVCGATSGATSSLRCFDFDGALAQAGAAAVGVNVVAPLAVDAQGGIWSGSQDGKLNRSVFAAGVLETTTVASLTASIGDSPIVAGDGDVFVGDEAGYLRRLSPAGVSRWADAPNLGAAVLAPMMLRGGPCAVLVSTRGGTVHAVRGDGLEDWRGVLAAGTELRSPNIYTPPGQPAGAVMSTAYVAGADGKLYAVIVDGELDTSAPWPKAFHDPRNTNNAGTQP
ncbi:pyrrolo-quinoline quinone [Anaeromyxobacter soli]|uniref:pyrrolo-quinoline quinone n=1 Tax=Anaeromyxobacter soli TaxID=2922725 RepID=UPI001FAFD5C1|nr:pyrrolo-quinoline quinone [Anaeromyxobacter sp. SG29]